MIAISLGSTPVGTDSPADWPGGEGASLDSAISPAREASGLSHRADATQSEPGGVTEDAPPTFESVIRATGGDATGHVPDHPGCAAEGDCDTAVDVVPTISGEEQSNSAGDLWAFVSLVTLSVGTTTPAPPMVQITSSQTTPSESVTVGVEPTANHGLAAARTFQPSHPEVGFRPAEAQSRQAIHPHVPSPSEPATPADGARVVTTQHAAAFVTVRANSQSVGATGPAAESITPLERAGTTPHTTSPINAPDAATSNLFTPPMQPAFRVNAHREGAEPLPATDEPPAPVPAATSSRLVEAVVAIPDRHPATMTQRSISGQRFNDRSVTSEHIGLEAAGVAIVQDEEPGPATGAEFLEWMTTDNRTAPAPRAEVVVHETSVAIDGAREPLPVENIDRLVNAALERVERITRPNAEEFEVQLTPPELGTLKVAMRRTDQGIEVSLTARDPQTQSLFDAARDEILHGLRTSRTESVNWQMTTGGDADSRRSPTAEWLDLEGVSRRPTEAPRGPPPSPRTSGYLA